MVVREPDAKLSPRQVFGAMLRFYRMRARLSQEQLGALVHFSGDLVGKIENGQRSPSQEFTTACDALPGLGADGALGELRKRLGGYFREGAFPGWFYWPDHEVRASALRSFEPLAVARLSFARGSVPGVTVEAMTYPLTTAQAKLAELVAEARRSHRPVTISEHGQSVAALINVDDLADLEDRAALAGALGGQGRRARRDQP